MDISLIIPAYNAEKIILKSLAEFAEFLKNKDYEILVICNGCVDNTTKFVRETYKNNKTVKVYELNKAEKGTAILYGFKKARGNVIGFIDADNPFGAKAIDKLVSKIKNGKTDCAIINKWRSGKRVSTETESFRRRIGSAGWNLLIRLFLGLKFNDSQSGAKFLSREALDSIDKNFICTDFEFDIELLLKLQRKNFRIKEVYMPLKKSEGTTFNIYRIPIMFLNLIKLWLK